MGSLAWAGTLPPKPLERFCTPAFPKLATEHTPSIRFTFWRRVAYLSLCRVGMGIFRVERTIPFVAGASRAERSEPIGEPRRSALYKKLCASSASGTSAAHANTTKIMEQNKPRIRLFAVLLKAIILIALCNFAFIFLKGIPLGKFSLYNSIFPGRERLPFGEHPQAYNLSMFNLDAMFASHILTGTPKTVDEYRVFLIGDFVHLGNIAHARKRLSLDN